MAKRAPSWKPRRRGNIYCSPACGRGCTAAEYVGAKEEAEAMASKAKGFEPRVTENLGWHASAEALDGHITIRKTGKKYHALASVTNAYAGNPEWGSVSGRTPQQAVDKIRAGLKHKIAKLQEFLEKLEELNG